MRKFIIAGLLLASAALPAKAIELDAGNPAHKALAIIYFAGKCNKVVTEAYVETARELVFAEFGEGRARAAMILIGAKAEAIWNGVPVKTRADLCNSPAMKEATGVAQ